MIPPTDNYEQIARSLCSWFQIAQRDLPWRRPAKATRRDPYCTLVSEFMLQQTQVSRVLEYFEPFLERFPTVAVLARAREQSVLGMWAGLGYYRRAKNLHGTAQIVHREHSDCVPSDSGALLALPGVGRYTAGAIASIAFDQPEPIVDGNVSRVMQRLHGRHATAADANAWTWEKATSLVSAAASAGLSPGDTNEALMELGATICTPRGPNCAVCPLSEQCVANERGEQEDIPHPKRAAKRRPLYCAAVVITNEKGHILVEKRPSTGMWADMWQTPTLESDDQFPTPEQLHSHCAADLTLRDSLTQVATFEHQTTHRAVLFRVYAVTTSTARASDGRMLKNTRTLGSIALSNAQRTALKVAGIDI